MRTNKCVDGAAKKAWPADCIWPDPSDEVYFWEPEDAERMPVDEETHDMLAIKAYMDTLVRFGWLNDDYTLSQDDEDGEDREDRGEETFQPERGEKYWDNGFDIECWEADLIEHLNLLKLPLPSPVDAIQRIVGYEFINENLLRQAFTRRSFGAEYGTGNCEQLELIGDSVLNAVVTREMARQLMDLNVRNPHEPFSGSYSEGDLTGIRQHFISGEYIASRAVDLGLNRYILYGTGEEPSAGGAEDMMEALIGAVAVDCHWDWVTLESVVDKLLCIQLDNISELFRPSYYGTFNAWHQKHFGRMPDYEVSPVLETDNPLGCGYHCTLRFSVPENDKGLPTSQQVEAERETRSRAREYAALQAYSIVVSHGLWMRLKDAGITPELDSSINQLQELYQKKYISAPTYTFEERPNVGEEWHCSCQTDGVLGWGKAGSKTAAKKKAAFMALVRLFRSAGLVTEASENYQDTVEQG